MPEFLGTLLPLTALSKKSKKLNLFEEGKRFVDWLSATGQQAWQFLPLHPTAWNETNLFASPYTSFGIGINPLFVPGIKPISDPVFEKQNAGWLPKFAEFMALAEHFGHDNWIKWPKTYISADRLRYHAGIQAALYNEYSKLKVYANAKNILLIGDIPNYLPLNSPLVWAWKDCFEINSDGSMNFVSGAGAATHFIRQVWGHPLYNWKNQNRNLKLWQSRLSYAAKLYDGIRLDAAIAFYTFGKISVSDEKKDLIGHGPGDKVFVPLIRHGLKLNLRIFGEDVAGYDLSALQSAMKKLGMPGVSVFSLSLTNKSQTLDTKHFDPQISKSNEICYTSTHDTPTLLGFLSGLNRRQKKVIADALHIPLTTNNRELAVEVRNLLLAKSRRLIIPIQDWLNISRRLNIPGTISRRNWSYRVDVSKLKAPKIPALASKTDLL
jgi:4-alpha-glucanotransferase